MKFGWLLVQFSCLSVVDSDKRKKKKIGDKSDPFSNHKVSQIMLYTQ
jgi:hypothetical protein